MATLSPITASPNSLVEVSIPAPSVAPAKSKTAKPRKRVNTAEKRSQHNAIERARRETLNGKFLGLAKLLPSLAASRRPSKSSIVNGSIEHLTFQRDQRLLAAKLLKQLCAERDELLDEVNSWRKVNGCALKDAQSAWTEEMEEIASVEKEVFGSFTYMGDDGDGDDDDVVNESSEQLNASSYTASIQNVNGLITPRSSTDFDAALNQQALFTSAPVNDARVSPADPTVGLNGINWSADFALGLTPVQAVEGMSFGNGFVVADASGSSPVTSHQGTNIVTPPAMSELMYTHTPSPASSNGLVMPTEALEGQHRNSTATPWTAAQFAMIQQQVQQAQQAQLQQAQQAASQHQQQQQQQQPFNPITGNTFNAMFGQQLHGNVHVQAQAQQAMRQQSMNAMPMLHPDAFTQSLVASMFPQHGRVPGVGPVSMEDLHKAIRTGVGLGMGMVGNGSTTNNNPWPRPVEGF